MFLCASENGMVLIDAGWPGFEWRVKNLMNSLHRNDLRLIVITHGHFDHYGSASAIRQLTNAPIAIQELDDIYMAEGTTELGQMHGSGCLAGTLLPIGEFFLQVQRTLADILFDDNFSLKPYGIDASVIHTPGHTPGSSTVILYDSIAFCGDLLSRSGTKIESQRYFAHDWYRQAYSLILLKSKSPLRTYPAHGKYFITTHELFDLIPHIAE
jgi:glyoxylase-like metal-dependent hydrolase (beta-lactamase superfamily II)